MKKNKQKNNNQNSFKYSNLIMKKKDAKDC